MPKLSRVGLIGFGQAGQILARELAAAGAADIAAFDVLFADRASGPSRSLDACAVRDCASAAAAADGAELVICAVTPAQGLEAARAVAWGIEKGAYYLDLNSAAPSLKQLSAGAIEGRGGRYVEAAVMAPLAEARLAAPMLLGGRYASAFLDLARPLGFSGATLFSEQVGKAAAAEMCCSAMLRGFEALMAESLLAARRHGVEATVLSVLTDLAPAADWPALARGMIAGSLEGGARHAADLSEIARTLEEAGVMPLMTRAAARRHGWAAALGPSAEGEDLAAALDRVLGRIDDA
jgi:3-hydroxyisobutyrate dehydrogenase-like beta-hydroxyacid dehydrogenase